jgi:hypothetical protein
LGINSAKPVSLLLEKPPEVFGAVIGSAVTAAGLGDAGVEVVEVEAVFLEELVVD